MKPADQDTTRQTGYTAADEQTLFACPACDALQHRPELMPKAAALCWRCDAVLVRSAGMNPDRVLAFTLTAAVLFCTANFSPLFALDLQGLANATTLFGMVQSLWTQHMQLLATLVFATTLMFPLLEISMLIYVLMAFRRGRENLTPGILPLLRTLSTVKRWGMIEVFMLGSIVALVKLSHLATVHPGWALWALGGVMLLLAGISASIEPRLWWARMELHHA